MAILSTIGKSIYKAATTRAGATMIVGGAAAAGLAGQVAPAARDAAMDVAFGDPNADTAFLGRKLTPGAIFDANVPGSESGRNTMIMTGGVAGIGSLIGGLARGRKGALVGGAVGGTLGAIGSIAMGVGYINRNERFFRESPYVGNRRLNRETMSYQPLSGARNTSLQTAQDLNADGNIVLGMHNMRRG